MDKWQIFDNKDLITLLKQATSLKDNRYIESIRKEMTKRIRIKNYDYKQITTS